MMPPEEVGIKTTLFESTSSDSVNQLGAGMKELCKAIESMDVVRSVENEKLAAAWPQL
jgi:hypothetical protein